jgi:hypothetical protein
MSVAIPLGAIAILVVLAVVAKERQYEMTSAGLMVLTAVLACWLAGLFWMFG